MPCDAVAVSTAQIESQFLEQLLATQQMWARLKLFFQNHPDLNEKYLVPPNTENNETGNYSYYNKGIYIYIGRTSGTGVQLKPGEKDLLTILIKTSRWSKTTQNQLIKEIKEIMEDEAAIIMRNFTKKIIEANGGKVIKETNKASGGYSIEAEITV